MQHLDPDRLVLLALSDDPGDPGESDHLAGCAACRYDLVTLRHVCDLGAEGQDLQDLPPAPERIWRAIEAELTPRSHQAVPKRRFTARRWLVPVLAAAAAAVLAIVGTVTVQHFAGQGNDGRVTARATLTPLPTVPPTATGTVEVLAGGQMQIAVHNLPLTTGFHEVWLIDPADGKKMVSLGNLSDRPDVVLPVPPGTDLNQYRLVDVSDEPHDGNAAHSGHSLLRGTLTY